MDPRTNAEFEQAAQAYIADARELLDLGVDVVKLHDFATHDIPATWLLEAFAKREKVSRLTKVMRAYNLIKQVRAKNSWGRDVPLTWQGVVEIFLTLQDLGCGFLVGNAQSGYDHFLWSANLATVGRVAATRIHMGALDRVEAMALESRAHSRSRQDQAMHLVGGAPARLPLPKPKPAGSIAYHFWVRPDSPVTFSLPSNLTPGEAKRLASFIRTMPFSGIAV
jgi:hypothetical protein